MKSEKLTLKLFFAVSILSYLIFFFPALNNDKFLYSGKDSTNYHYPAAYYLKEKLDQSKFPFYTNRLFQGHPIYADIESGYLNPIYTPIIGLLGPITGTKVVHFATYLAGSYGLFLLLKKRDTTALGYIGAHFAYFFTFFALYHQQHFNITRAFYLLPLLLWFTEEFRDKKLRKHLTFMLITYLVMFYFGSFQTVFTALITQGLYLLSFPGASLRKLSKFYIVYGLLAILISLPLLLPAKELFSQSLRSELGYTEGSLSPVDSLAIVFPTPFGDDSNYFGTQINQERLKHETYMYVGVITFMLVAIGFTKADLQTKRFFRMALLGFIILGFIKYVPFLRSYFVPPFTLFRYWGRFIITPVFASSLLVAQSFSIKKNQKVHLSKFLPHILLSISAVIIWLFTAEVKNTAFHLVTNANLGTNLIVWTLLPILALTLIVKNSNYKRLGLLALLVFDLVFFGKQVTMNDFRDVGTLVTEDRHYNKGLYEDKAGVFGYTPLASSEYQDYMISKGHESEKTSKKVPIKENLFRDYDQEMICLLEAEEDFIVAVIESEEKTQLETNIRNYSDWQITLNNDLIDHNDGLFITLPLEEGTNNLIARYEPITFYKSMVLSFGGISLIALYLLLNKNEKLL